MNYVALRLQIDVVMIILYVHHCCWSMRLIWLLTWSLSKEYHSLEIRGLCSTQCCRKTLCYILCITKKTCSFFVFHFENFWVLLYEWPGLCQHRPQGIHKKKLENAQNEKNYMVFFAVTDQTWVITKCRNKEGFFLEITEVLSEVHTNYFSNFRGIF